MSGQEELIDKDPFGEDEVIVEEENIITEKMVKKATFLIHRLAEQKGKEYKNIQKACRNLFKYENLAKVSKEQGHAIINKLLELTGREEEEKPEQGAKNEEKETVQEKDDAVTGTMREAVRAAVDITLTEVVEKDVPVQGLGGFVLEIAKVIFEAKLKEGEQ